MALKIAGKEAGPIGFGLLGALTSISQEPATASMLIHLQVSADHPPFHTTQPAKS